MNKDELSQEIDRMSNLVSTARAGLDRGEIVEVGDLCHEVQTAMGEVGLLEADDAAAIRPDLMSLLAEMEAFSQELQVKIDTLAEPENAGGAEADSPDDASTDSETKTADAG